MASTERSRCCRYPIRPVTPLSSTPSLGWFITLRLSLRRDRGRLRQQRYDGDRETRAFGLPADRSPVLNGQSIMEHVSLPAVGHGHTGDRILGAAPAHAVAVRLRRHR